MGQQRCCGCIHAGASQDSLQRPRRRPCVPLFVTQHSPRGWEGTGTTPSSLTDQGLNLNPDPVCAPLSPSPHYSWEAERGALASQSPGKPRPKEGPAAPPSSHRAPPALLWAQEKEKALLRTEDLPPICLQLSTLHQTKQTSPKGRRPFQLWAGRRQRTFGVEGCRKVTVRLSHTSGKVNVLSPLQSRQEGAETPRTHKRTHTQSACLLSSSLSQPLTAASTVNPAWGQQHQEPAWGRVQPGCRPLLDHEALSTGLPPSGCCRTEKGQGKANARRQAALLPPASPLPRHAMPYQY